MTQAVTLPAPGARSIPRSIGAVFAGFVFVFVTSLGVDQVLHVLHVYPPWGQPNFDVATNVLPLVYRFLFDAIGAYLVAALAPRNPVRHVWVYAAIGLVIGTVGAIGAMPLHLGPAWYGIGVAVSAIPASWLGGMLYLRTRATPAVSPTPA